MPDERYDYADFIKDAIGDKLVLFETKNYNVLCGGAGWII